jgi:dinuclear metal center YbgI/SA1388 family protein
MPQTVADVLDHLDTMVGFSKAAGWDAVGLQFGDSAERATTVAVCHEVTPDVVAAVVREPVDVLVSYHPLLFRPFRRLVAGRSAEGRAYRLIRAGVALAVVHTAYDVVPGGVADTLAEALGLTATAGFGPSWGADAVKIVTFLPAGDADAVAEAMATAGAGRIGSYTACSFRAGGTGAFRAPETATPTVGTAGAMNHEPEMRLEMIAPRSRRDGVVAALVAAHPYEEPAFDVYETAANAGFIGRHGVVEPTALGRVADHVRRVLGSSVRVAGPADREIARIAVVPGSGSSFVGEASTHADVLVTGDVSHHRARDAMERGLAIIDAGHVATERPGVQRLYAELADSVGAKSLLHLDPSPWKEA